MHQQIMLKIKAVRSATLLAGALLCIGALPAASAQSLLNGAQEAQLSAWLGEGPLALTAIYTKSAGDTSRDFHLAADGKGRTFSVMQASNSAGQTWLVGGYNPQSWNSSGNYNMTPEDRDRTAFIFNLTSGQHFRQTPKTYALDSVGAYQTFNDINAGPTFGIGADLGMSADLSTNGISSRYSYIDPVNGIFGASLLDGTPYGSYPNVTFGAMQVFSVSAVPEPAMLQLLLAGLLLVGTATVRHRKLSVPPFATRRVK
ncbi:PEP_CTERM-anchored TLD domain-containing protein [Janthinobacterium sp. NKUCC06_STL]|uniref:PEP_CTERM-anchored TLD domain-containing protein n=1 Tax=Janthinobacterium sp. NKUCC06_STL TaxID=2842127 RepID=UPI00214BBF0B|nr:PEP_CTERM-anchored TLD domain-containing protein [Janthinobacterium sp. NKUCC06_STL]